MSFSYKFLLSLFFFLCLGTAVNAQAVQDSHIAAGNIHGLFIDPEGNLWSWGESGLPHNGNHPFPEIVTRDAHSVYADPHAVRSFVIKQDQSLWGWGNSDDGQLGVVRPVHRGNGYIPLRKLMDKAVRVSGKEVIFALAPDYSLWVWGAGYVQRGDGIRETTTRPLKIMKDVIRVSSSMTHTLALKKDGTLWAWGDNQCGALGTGDDRERIHPVKIDLTPLGGRKIVRVATRMTESFLVTDDGSVWNWGEPNNMKPYCMDEPRWVPVKLAHIDHVADIAVGFLHEVYLKKDGSVWVTGYAEGAASESGGWKPPTKMMDGAAEIAAGEYHSLVLKKDGTLWAWGKNQYGQLGDGTTETRLAPVQVRFDLKPEDLPLPDDRLRPAPGFCEPLPIR